MKILVIQQRYGIGDMVIFSPYFHAIFKKHQNSITLLAKKSSKAEELFLEDDSIEEIISLEKNMDGLKGFFTLARILDKKNFDKVYIFNGSLRYKILAHYLKIKSVFHYPLFTSKDIIYQTAKIFTENCINQTVSTIPNLKIKTETIMSAKKSYNFDDEFNHIVLGISASGPTKRWGIKNFISLAKELSIKKKCKFYLAAGKNDQELINEFLSTELKTNSFSLSNLKIKEIMPIIKNCDLYIGNDTGFMHISAGLGINCLGLFFDSPAYAYSSYTNKIKALVPVGKTILTTTHNTLGKNNISFDEVVHESKKYLTK